MRCHARVLILGFAVGACQRQAAEGAPTPSAVSAVAPAALGAAWRLPEDPEAGARSVAQWRQHLEQEERERRLRYDRRKLSQHREVSRRLREMQSRYDRASSESAVTAAHKIFIASLPQLEKSFDAIDHHGDSSRLLPEYRELQEVFSDSYPRARVAALTGSKAALDELASRLKIQFEAIDAWLQEASRDEED